MPVGKELGKFKGIFTSVRTCEVNGEQGVVEGTYTAKVSGQLSGTAVGTLTFSGSNARGTANDLGTAYLASGDVINYKTQGVYWSGSHGKWETRGAVMMGDQMLVVEGQISMSDGVFSSSGKIFELK